MADDPRRHHTEEHDWHSARYVDEWLAGDEKRESRRAAVRGMLGYADVDAGAEIEVLDVGAGDGLVAEEVLAAFPNARATLLDYSEPMLARSRERLASSSGRVRIVRGDLASDEWTARVGGPFDLAVSAIAIHNLRCHGLIAACYRAICSVLKPRGTFLDLDLPTISGGLDAHLRWLREAGFARVECVYCEEPRAIFVARRR
jgi:ubiquinone/menaquinone biosynthesis C-methylase UbiE